MREAHKRSRLGARLDVWALDMFEPELPNEAGRFCSVDWLRTGPEAGRVAAYLAAFEAGEF